MNLNIQRFSDGKPSESETASNDFASMTQGISASGIKAVYDEIHSHIIEDAQTALNDTAGLKTALEQGWKSADRDVFIANLDKLATDITTKLTEYDNAIQKEFTSIAESWDTFQKSNVSAH